MRACLRTASESGLRQNNEPGGPWRVAISDHVYERSYAYCTWNSSKSPSPRTKLSDHHPADQGGCRDRACDRPRYQPRSRRDRPRADLGRGREGPSGSGGGRLARLARSQRAAAARRQPCPAGHGRGIVAAAWHEDPFRPDPPGPQDGARATSTASPFRASARTPFPPAMRCTWARWHPRPAHCRPAPAGHSRACGRPLADARRGPGALGERRRRRIRAGAILERLLRLWTGYPLEASQENDHADS